MNQQLLKEKLLEFSTVMPRFTTGNPEAEALVQRDPFALLVAAAIDRRSVAEIVWIVPYCLSQQLGELDPQKLSQMAPDTLAEILRKLPKKPYTNQAARTIVSLAKLITEGYDGDAGRIWKGKSVADVLANLDRIWGVGLGIANMTVRILIENGLYKPSVDELKQIDIKPDVHVTRVFYRSGLSPSSDSQRCIEAARRLHPQFPGELAPPAWMIGRKYCHEKRKPECSNCPLGDVCPRREVSL